MNQVLRIVDKAKASICFGLSGTPIKANGEILSKFVLFSTYDYDSAVTYDQSMKRISALEQNFGFQVEEINITEAELINDGEILSTKDANQLNYDKNAIPRKSVCEGVIRYVRSCDDFLQSFSSNEDLARLAEHRPRGSRPILKYAVHAMIVVDTVEVGIALCEMLNKMFENNRMLFPLEEGYRAEVVHSEIAPPQPNEFLTKETKARLKAKKLTVNHPWMEYQKTGQLSEKCARFLFVDGIGREGVSNKFCGCVGYACGVGSLVEMVQRGLGRQARDYHKVDIDGITLLTPPVRLDTIKIITHITFGNTSIIKSALRYICNMEDSLKEMPNIDQLIEGLSPNKDAELDPEAPLFDAERLAIARYMGEQKINQDPIDYRYIENRWGGNESPKKRQKIQEWVKQVLDAPEEAAKQLNHSDILEKVIIVNKESPISRPSDEDLIQFVKTHKPQHQAMLDKIELVRELFVTMYHDHAKSFHYLGHLPNTTNIDEIRKSMAASIIMSLGDCYKGPRRTVYAFVGAAVKHIVGTDAPVSIGGQYDNPQTHLLLTRPEMKKRIHGWVRRKLIKKGFCPELATIFNVKVEENKDGFPET
jgi:hypothetical protein